MSRRDLLLKALASMPGDVARLVHGQADTAGRIDQLRPGDVLAHLLLVEAQAVARMRQVVVAERPSLPPLPALETGPDAGQPARLLPRLAAARQETLAFLHGLRPGDWQRTAVLPGGEVATLRGLVQELVAHDTHHLEQMVAMKTRLAAENTPPAWPQTEET